MYVLRSKVSLSDASSDLMRLGLTGDCASALLQPRFPAIPNTANEVVQHAGFTLIRLPGASPRFELLAPAEDLITFWQAAAEQAIRLGDDFWALQEIRAGVPIIYPATSEAFVPQMTNMQLVDGVSFTKGCYTGQEVVARMQYLGKLKRRMYLAHVSSESQPQPGDELYSAGSTSGQGTGKVVDARPANGGYDLLAVIEAGVAESHEICLGEKGPRLELRQLPYPFPE
jgi:folate-binding protein YgfZ